MKVNKLIVLILGIYFLSLGILAIGNVLFKQNYSGILWMCYFGLLFLGIGMLLRNSKIVLSQLNILMIPLLFWNVDFFYRWITGNSLFGITDYFFLGRTTLSNIITLQHIVLIPLALYSIYLIKLKNNDAWKISFLEIGLFFVISLLFTSVKENVNCVFESCVSFIQISGILYNFVWFVILFGMILITNFVIVFVFRRFK